MTKAKNTEKNKKRNKKPKTTSVSFWSKLKAKFNSIGAYIKKRKYCIGAIIILCAIIWLIA